MISHKFTFKDSLMVLLILLVFQIIGSVIGLTFQALGLSEIISFAISSFVGFTLAIACILVWFKISFASLINSINSIPSILPIVVSVVFYLSILPLAEWLTGLIPTDIPYLDEKYNDYIKSFEKILENKAVAFFLLCIVAPIFEEIIFRGLMLKGMLNAKINPYIAIGISSILFGAAHLNPWQFVGAGLLGASFGYVFYRTNSLLLCMFLHFLNNFIGFYSIVIFGDMEQTMFEANYQYIISGTLIALLSGYTLFKLTTYENTIRINKQRENL